jgi:three-Cys-motif partner protein
MSVLLVQPPFTEYHFIDLDRGNIEILRQQVASGGGSYEPDTVFIYNDDCNHVLLSDVFPRARYDNFARALCLLDPYGLDLDWEVTATAGKMRSVEIFLNFPIMDMNRNALWKNPDNVDQKQRERMSRYWGNDSWRQAAYSSELNLFGLDEKTSNQAVAAAFRHRLQSDAGFSFVPEPMPMRNSRGVTVYYLFFASQNEVGAKIVNAIFNKYRNRAG